MKNCIYISQSIREQAFKTFLGKGLRIDLDLASKPMIKVLQMIHSKDTTILEGDIESLMSKEVHYN